MRWNLRMAAAERGIWKSTELRRALAESGLEISTGKIEMKQRTIERRCRMAFLLEASTNSRPT